MLFSPFIALRYLKPKRSFVSIITVISIIGVTLGVWLLTVVMAVFAGYGKKMQDTILGFSPHLEMRAGGYIEDFVPILEQLETVDGVEHYTPYVFGNVIMEFNKMRSAPFIRAIHPPEEGSSEHKRLSALIAERPNPKYDPENAPDEPEMVPAGEFYLDPYSAVVGDAMARNLGISVGDQIQLFSPKDMEELMRRLDEIRKGNKEEREKATLELEEATLPQEVTVTGIFDSGNMDFDSAFVYIALETGQVLYNFDLEQSHGVAIRIKDAFEADRFKDDLLVAMGMGTRQKLDYSPAAMATQQVLHWPLLIPLVALAGLILGLGYFLSKRSFPRILIATLVLLLIAVGLRWGQAFIDANANLYYVEHSSGGPPYELLTWMQIHEGIFNAIAAERGMMYLILFMVLIVAAFCTMNTMITMTFQKRSEIGLMTALGARENQVAGIFISQGIIVGLIGVVFGLLIGQLTIWKRNAIANWLGAWFGIEFFNEDVYRIEGGLPAHQTLSDIAVISIGSFIICTIAAVIPAIIAARLQPAEALRSE